MQQNTYEKWLETIESTPDLDGGGPFLAPVFEKILRGKKFITAFEWCAGPAWIGMWLLENNICKTLVTGDTNRESVDLVRKSAKKHDYNIRSYCSDNLKNIPEELEEFDLVVGSPPSYCNIQESHPLGHLRHDLRPSDLNWNIHKDFYNNISYYLKQDAVMFIAEVELFNRKVYINNELYDERPELPIEVFKRMTRENNLSIKKIIPHRFLYLDCHVLEIHRDF